MKMESKVTKDGYFIEHYPIDLNLDLVLAYEGNEYAKSGNGGLRLSSYKNIQHLSAEALILAKHMTQKHQLYDTGFSGAKFVANGAVTNKNKIKLLQVVGDVLNKYDGKLFTGCDLNINNQDMEYLSQFSAHILNALYAPSIDTSTATAYGVYAAFQAILSCESKAGAQKVIVCGVGKIGTVLVRLLLEDGHDVFTYDVNYDRADVSGATNLSDHNEGYTHACDFLFLCSTSHFITMKNVHALQCNWIVSSANAPFESDAVEKVLRARGISWLPDVVSNAGAVLCDSIEYYEPERYRNISGQSMYNCVFRRIYQKTCQLYASAGAYNIPISQALDIFLTVSKNELKLPEMEMG